jgi:hypothetical protein
MKSCKEIQAKKLSTQKSDGKMSFFTLCKSFWSVTMLNFFPTNIFLKQTTDEMAKKTKKPT